MSRITLRVLCLCALLASLAFGQSDVAFATLNGTVSDPSGATIGGAKVTVSSPATGFVRSSVTTDAGLYSFNRLPVGTYNLTVEMQGFKTAKLTSVQLGVGAVATLDVKLEVGAASESVSVTAEVPIVETTRSTSATTVSEKAVADLPVNGRNFLDFTTLTPGVVRDPTRGGDLSFGGQRGPANTLLVDGADSNNLFFGQATGRTGFRPYAFSQDAVQEFQVNANNYPAEIGRAGGGAINVVTKSGTNDFHGSAFWFFRDKGLNANSFVNNRAGIARLPYHFHQFGASAGGRIIKDKLFFFGNYDAQRNKNNQLVAPIIPPTGAALDALRQFLTPYETRVDNNVFLAKIDWNVGANDRLSVRFNGSRYTGKNLENAGLSRAQESTGDNKVNTNNVAASWTHVFGSSLLWEARFNYVGDEQPGFANATGPEVSIINGITFGKNNFSPRFTNTKAYQPINTFSWTKGRHSFKFGQDINIVRVENFFPGLFAGQYVFQNYAAFLARTPSNFNQAFSGTSTQPPISNPNVTEYAFFAQDSWRVNNRLTLNYGLRYDLFDYNQPNTLNPDAGLAAAGLRTNRINVDKVNFGPRFGFAYQVLQNEKLVIRGGYGIYFARVPGLLLSTAILQNGIDVRNFSLTPTTPGFPTYPNILPGAPAAGAGLSNIYVTTPNFRTPLTQQFSFQAESQISRNYAVTVGYLGVNAYNLSRSRDINLFPTALTTGLRCPTTAACTADTGGVPFQYLRRPSARPNPNFGRITLFDDGANSIYHGGFAQVTRRFSNNLQLLASYTLAKVIDSVPDGTSVVPNNFGDDSKVAQDTLNPNLDRGPGAADIRHRFVFSTVWDLNYFSGVQNAFAKAVIQGWQLSAISQVQSGRRFNAQVTGDPGNDGNQANDRAPFVGRNTIQGPAFMAVDLRISKDIALGTERVRLKLIGEAFNLTNRANFSALNVNQFTYANTVSGNFIGQFRPVANPAVASSAFLFRQNTFDPRIWQIAAKIVF